MKIIYRFKAYPPNPEEGEANYQLPIHVETHTQKDAKDFLIKRGFYGIDEDGHIAVYQAKN